MKGLLWVLFEKVGLAALSMLVAFWYAILLGPEGFGIASMFLATTLLVTAIQNNMQQNPLVATNLDFASAMYASIKGWLLISVVTVALLYFALISYWGGEYWLLVLVCICHVPISSISKVLLAELLRNQEYKTIALRSVLGKLLGVVAGIALAYMGKVKLAILVQSLVDISVQLVIMATRSQLFSLSKVFTRFSRKETGIFVALLREGIPSGLSVIDGSFKNRGALILLGVLLGPYSSGVFALAMKLVDVPRTMIGYGLTTWAIGKLRASANSDILLRDVFVSVNHIGILVLAPAYLGMAAISLPLLTQFFGSEWAEASVITMLLCFYYLVLSLQLFVPPLLVIKQRTHKTMWATILSSVIAIVGSVFLVPALQIYGLLVALFLSLIPLLYKQDSETSKLLGVTTLNVIKETIGLILSAIIMLSALAYSRYWLEYENLYLLIVIGVFSYTLCLSFLYLLGMLDKAKFKKIISL